MIRSSAIRRRRLFPLASLAAVIGVIVAVSGCGPATELPSGSAGPSPVASAAFGSASPAAPSPSAAAPSASPGPSIAIADPDLAMTLPPGWEEQLVSAYRDRINTQSAQNTGSVRAAMEELVRDADAGKVRILATGLTDYRAAYGSIIIQVNKGDPSLAAAIKRIEKRHDFGPHSDFEERDVELAVGKGVRMSAIFPVGPNSPPAAIPSHTIDYVIRLQDGRTLWIQASAPEAAKAFDAVIDSAVATLTAR
jgi:hypothetical protein